MPDHHEVGPAAERARALELLDLGAGRELTAAEEEELARLLERHPGVEYTGFEGELDALDALGPYRDEQPPPGLRARVLAADPGAETGAARPYGVPHGAPGGGGVRPLNGRRPLRGRLGMLVAAAALVGFGAVGGAVVTALADRVDGPPTGPPGTLGAVEPIAFDGEPDGVAVDASVVAHTWGTETLLDVDGLPVGDTFTVVVISSDGTEFDSGAFIASEVPVVCAVNAAVLRPDVGTIEIRDVDGATVMASELPPATS
ncbi:hypothetical protein [Streptomyces otsuchiensis]|uniref:hypothetical protein n=2 Tax=Streptomyces TaxID=1883 RepID=UPI001031DA1F|nr:hypothetical protein [Streptomyces otsuchiensis]